jgi:GT2 family glycosyltransferase
MPGLDASVVICTHNRADELMLVLDDLAAQSGLGGLRCEVLVIDNASTDATRARVEARMPGFPLPLRYAYEGEQGKSFALNRGIAEAQADILVFTDDDVRIPTRWLRAMLAPFENRSCMGVGGAVRPRWDVPPPPWVSESDPYRMMAAIVQYWQGPRVGITDTTPIGANCAWRREVFARHGGYRTDLGPAGERAQIGEDTEFGLRMQSAGEEIWYTPDALLFHPVAPERLTQRYFLDWYYHSGVAEAYRPATVPSYRIGGIPRYLFREIARSAIRWAWTRAPDRRFFYKLLTWQAAGRIRGYRERHLASMRT